MAGGKADAFPPVVVIYILFLILLANYKLIFQADFIQNPVRNRSYFFVLNFFIIEYRL